MSFPPPFVEPTQRRIRVRRGDEVVADSGRALLLVRYDATGLPTYFLPLDDLTPGVLSNPSEDGVRRWDVTVAGETVPGAAWAYADPSGPLAPLAEHISFSWSRLSWFEEDEQVFVHARDPYKRVDTLWSSRHVQVFVAGELVADSRTPLLVFETHLPTRYYLPRGDVRTEFLEPSNTVTACPYKGSARYWSIMVDGQLHPDLVWGYPDPIPENPKLEGLVCFYNEHVDLVIDGVAQARPVTPWSAATESGMDVAHLET
jgi:uncharacterized protein (DUF427 family)